MVGCLLPCCIFFCTDPCLADYERLTADDRKVRKLLHSGKLREGNVFFLFSGHRVAIPYYQVGFGRCS